MPRASRRPRTVLPAWSRTALPSEWIDKPPDMHCGRAGALQVFG
jgi:hypothetical protein